MPTSIGKVPTCAQPSHLAHLQGVTGILRPYSLLAGPDVSPRRRKLRQKLSFVDARKWHSRSIRLNLFGTAFQT